MFDDQADYFSTDTEAWLDPAELAARRKLRAEVEAARQRQRSTLTVTFDFAGRQVVSHADDADRAALDKRFGVVEQQSSSVGDAELEKRLAAELDEVERVKLISMTDKSVPSTAVAPAGAAASSSSSVATSSVDVHLSTAPIAPLQIKPSDNIEMRPIALPRESHHASEASKKSASKNNNNNENKQSKRGKSNVSTAVAGAGGKKRHEKVQSEHDELF